MTGHIRSTITNRPCTGTKARIAFEAATYREYNALAMLTRCVPKMGLFSLHIPPDLLKAQAEYLADTAEARVELTRKTRAGNPARAKRKGTP